MLPAGAAQAQRKHLETVKAVAEYFTRCLADGEFDSLLTITPPASVMRLLSVPAAELLSDPEPDNAVASWPQLRAAFELLLAEARARNINLATLRVTAVSSEPLPVSPKVTFITTAFFDAAGVEGEFTLGTVNHNKRWYLWEIRKAEEVFQ